MALHYVCGRCKREFRLEVGAAYCPFCGSNLSLSIGCTSDDREPRLSSTTLWGDEAKIKTEFSNIIRQCIGQINFITSSYINCSLINPDLSGVDKSYSKIKVSSNRKVLISRIDACLSEIDCIICKLSQQGMESASNSITAVVDVIRSVTFELYSLLDIHDTAFRTVHHPSDSFSVQVHYTVEQMQKLYSLVLMAYEKYKRCVERNNMFAAFSSTSDYGMLPEFLRKMFCDSIEPYDDVTVAPQYGDTTQTLKFDEVIDYMEKQNEKQYLGLLDEDFAPHVDAFWFGMDMLRAFLKDYASIDYDEKTLMIDEAQSTELLHAIDKKAFELTESRFQKALELRDRIRLKYTELVEKG